MRRAEIVTAVLMSAMMLVCCVWIAINWVRRASPPSRSDAPFMDSFARNKFVLVGGGVTAMIGLVHFVGMYGAIPAFLVYYLRFLGRHSWLTTLAIALGARRPQDRPAQGLSGAAVLSAVRHLSVTLGSCRNAAAALGQVRTRA
jgi:hypothetical protein